MMDGDHFLSRVMDTCLRRSLLSEVIVSAYERAKSEWQNRITEGKLLFPNEYAETIERLIEEAQDVVEHTSRVPKPPERALIELEQFEKIRPQLDALRRETQQLVASAYPYLDIDLPVSVEKAAKWVEKVVKSDPKPTKKEAKKAEQLWNEADALCGEMERLLHRCYGDIAVESRTSSALQYLNEESEPYAVVLDSESPLLRLAQETTRLGEHTGFSQRTLVQWVLSGDAAVKPELPRFVVNNRVSLSARGGMRRRYAIVLVNHRLTRRDFEDLLKELDQVPEDDRLPRAVKRGRKSQISEHDRRMIETVGRLYGESPKSAAQWRVLFKKINTPYGAEDWKSLRSYWYRIERRARKQRLNLPLELQAIFANTRKGENNVEEKEKT